MNGPPSDPPEPLTKKLLGCWLEDPRRFGTVESIVEWWLLEQWIQRAAMEVRAALAALVTEGLVEQWTEADGRTYYKLNPDKKAEASAWIEGSF